MKIIVGLINTLTGENLTPFNHHPVKISTHLTILPQVTILPREISGILQGVPELSLEDEAAVEAELEALMMEENGVAMDQLPEVPQTQPLPVAPTTPLPDLVAATTESEQPVAIAS